MNKQLHALEQLAVEPVWSEKHTDDSNTDSAVTDSAKVVHEYNNNIICYIFTPEPDTPEEQEPDAPETPEEQEPEAHPSKVIANHSKFR